MFILQAYNGSRVRVIGSVVLEIRIKSQKILVEFVITSNGFQPIDSANSKQRASEKGDITIKYTDVFTGYGRFPKRYKSTLRKDASPVSNASNRVPLNLKDKLEAELDRLCLLGVIPKIDEPTEWVSKLVMVSLRLCLDRNYLNKFINKKYYAIPNINDLKTAIGNAKYFSVLDLKESFWQIGLSDESKHYCTFSIIYGGYCFNVLPFELKILAEAFQEMCQSHFGDIRGLFSYVDDFLIFAQTKQENDAILQKVLVRARDLNVKFNVTKFQYLPS
ncbi:hypothetical protein PR048_005031 [Dryococelus australis]|uniref:Reverse transcriptase domain-containing protein n=1 Tax=Dryococelus australis TaxID=614101 RepID=A0ABQ9I741_9NEOP|nr:hypothetical protein PR048_005031 [Dryococelus australis]